MTQGVDNLWSPKFQVHLRAHDASWRQMWALELFLGLRCLWSGAWTVQPGNRGRLMRPQLSFAPCHPNCDSSKSSAPNSPLASTTPSCDRFWSQSKPLIFIHILQEVWELRKWPRFRLLGQEVRHLQPWQLLFIVSAMYALNQNANVVKLIFTCNSKCSDTICRDWEQVKRINL